MEPTLENIRDGMSGDAQVLFEAGRKTAELKVTEVNGMPVAFVPKDFTLVKLPELLEKPLRIDQTIVVTTPQSFIDYFQKFSTDRSAILCNLDTAEFLAVLDHHEPEAPDNCSHKLKFKCERTEEHKAWLGMNGKHMSQMEFARFIEDNLEEIITPVGAEMLEIAQTLKATTKTNFVSGTSLKNGKQQFQYMEEIDGKAGTKGQFQIPETIRLGMRIFEGDTEGYPFEARFRYRIKEGSLVMWYDLMRPHKQYRDAVEHVHKIIREQTKCQLTIHGAL